MKNIQNLEELTFEEQSVVNGGYDPIYNAFYIVGATLSCIWEFGSMAMDYQASLSSADKK